MPLKLTLESWVIMTSAIREGRVGAHRKIAAALAVKEWTL
jgi:hypothetical protein